MVRIHLKKAKCDQFGAGADIVLGRTDMALCPVAAILDYICSRGPNPGAFFLNSGGHIVTKHWFVEQVRGALNTAGFPQHDYAGHSFRIGAATTAALVGIEDSTIQTLGRWQSAAFLQYIRMPKESLAALSSAMARTVS